MLKKNTNVLVFSPYVLPRNRQQNKCTYAANDVKANSLSFLSQPYFSIVICYYYYCEHLNQDYLYECACTCSWTLGSAWCKLGLKWWLLCSCHEATKMTYYLLWIKAIRLPMTEPDPSWSSVRTIASSCPHLKSNNQYILYLWFVHSTINKVKWKIATNSEQFLKVHKPTKFIVHSSQYVQKHTHLLEITFA